MGDATGVRQVWTVDATQTRTVTFYVEAESREAAEADAEELASGFRLEEWDDVEVDLYAHRSVQGPRPGRGLWTGGPDGEWVTVPDPKEGAR